MNELKLFPVLFPSGLRSRLIALGCPEFIRWDALNEGWAYQNHDQTLQRLAQRGGLDPTEIVANIEKRQWHNMRLADAVEFIKKYTPAAS
jgi:hypothetical protein